MDGLVWRVHAGRAEARRLACPWAGPFAADRFGNRPPGKVADLGGGWAALDQAAVETLAMLRWGDDFRVTWDGDGGGPVLHVGRDAHPLTPGEVGEWRA